MSRSYRKQPWQKYAPMGNTGQILANRRIRRGKYRNMEIPSGMAYKRLYSQYDIHDVTSRETLGEYLKRWADWDAWCEMKGYSSKPNYYGDTREEAIQKWKKDYIRK